MHQIDVDLLQCPCLGCDYKSPVSALVWRHMRVHKKWRSRVLRRELLRRRAQKQQQLQQEQEHLHQEATAEAQAAPAQPAPVKKTKYYAEKTCEICQRKFVNGKTLSKHVKTVHNKIKPFICNVCGKKTARKASLIVSREEGAGEWKRREQLVLLLTYFLSLHRYTCVSTQGRSRSNAHTASSPRGIPVRSTSIASDTPRRPPLQQQQFLQKSVEPAQPSKTFAL